MRLIVPAFVQATYPLDKEAIFLLKLGWNAAPAIQHKIKTGCDIW